MILVLSAIGFVVLLYLSGLFSGSETAFFSLSQLDLGEMDPRGRPRRLMEEPDRFLVGILLGNTLVNVAIGALGAHVALSFVHARGLSQGAAIALEVGVVTIVILIAGEIAPKMYAIQRNRAYAERSARVLSFFMSLFRHPVSALNGMASGMRRGLGDGEAPLVTAEELRTIIEVSEERGTLQEDERDMIDSVIEFGDTVVREVMVPRVDMECLEDTTSLGEAVASVKELGYSRIPVYHDDIDHISGVLYAKDLLRFGNGDLGRPVRDVVRQVYYTPESKNAGDLLREIQRDRIHMAIVVDEYGGTAGLVTLEDLIEEIVGEIRDEYDEEEPLITVVDRTTLVADGALRVEELAEELEVGIQSGEGVETLGGYLMEAFGRIPSEGEKLERDGLEFTVEEVDEQRIMKVRVVKVAEAAREGGGES